MPDGLPGEGRVKVRVGEPSGGDPGRAARSAERACMSSEAMPLDL
jgi:hypothetical protein